MRIKLILICITLTLSLSACLSYDFSRRIVQQGNLLPQEKLNQLKIGMSKQDAANLMGTSLMSPTFNNNRWDYAYTWRKGNSKTTLRHVSLYFTDDRLTRIER
jgi:outer membrane protein assembly factor BamE